MKIALYLLLASSSAWAQSSGKAATTTNPAPAIQSSASASPDAQALTDFLTRVQSTAQKSGADVARLHIDKWKTDNPSKQQALTSASSILRNLTEAVPDLVQRIQAAPGSLNANFRLYRDLNALYDTFSALVESAGAFGPRDQYDPLAADIAQLDQLRHQAADRVDLLAATNDAELARLRSQVSPGKGAKASSKVVVVDDDQSKAKRKTKPAQPQSTPHQ